MAHAEGSKAAWRAVGDTDTESDTQSAAPAATTAELLLLLFLLLKHPLPDQTSSQGYMHKHSIPRKHELKF